MRLTVLGAGPAYTNREGSTGACYLVEQDGTHLLLDLGQGSFPRIFRHVAPEDVDAVVISHLHPDHFIDLVPMRHYLRYYLAAAAQRPRRWGRPTSRPGSMRSTPSPGSPPRRCEASTLGTGPHRIGSFEVTAGLVTHTDESYAIRVAADAGGPGLVYSGDCGRADDLVPLVRPGDVLLAEASFGPGPVPQGAQHLDGPAVGRLATATRAGRVLLTHLQMGHDPDATIASCRGAYDGPVELVWPGDQFEL